MIVGPGRTQEISQEAELSRLRCGPESQVLVSFEGRPNRISGKGDAKDGASVGAQALQVWAVSATSEFAWALDGPEPLLMDL